MRCVHGDMGFNDASVGSISRMAPGTCTMQGAAHSCCHTMSHIRHTPSRYLPNHVINVQLRNVFNWLEKLRPQCLCTLPPDAEHSVPCLPHSS